MCHSGLEQTDHQYTCECVCVCVCVCVPLKCRVHKTLDGGTVAVSALANTLVFNKVICMGYLNTRGREQRENNSSSY